MSRIPWGGEAVKMGAVEFYIICTKVDEAKLRYIMIKTGDHYKNITFTTNIRDRTTKLLTMTYNLYIILLSIYQFSSTLLNCKRTVSRTPAGPKNICNVSPLLGSLEQGTL